MKKLKLIMAACALLLGWSNAMAEASYNHTYTEGVTVAAGGNYFLYNIGSKRFYTDGMDYGTHASADHAGRVVTLAEVSGGFTIYSSPVSANGSDAKAGYLIKNGSGEPYVDGANGDKVTVVFTAVDVDGYTNAYTIKIDDNNYLYYATADGLYQSKMGPFLRYGANTGDANSYWLIIPMSARQAVGDCTYLLRNGDFNHPWELPMWTNAAGWTNIAGGKKENPCAEMYGKGFDIYQTISETIANGRYKLSNQAFYNNADVSNQTYLYANSDQSPIAILNAHDEGTAANMAGASDAFSAGQYVNSVETFVSNGSLKVGIKNATSAGNAWNIMNNFHLDYLGQCVMDYAVALPDGGAMTADTWYYIDITVAGDNYNATATDLSKIICTTDGYTLTSAVTGDVTLTAKDNDLSVTRYYVKSVGEDNNLVVAPASYTYTVGTPTLSIADGAYTNNSLSTFTFNFSEATTNDPGASFAILNGSAKASLKKGGVEQAQGTLSLDGKVLTATFSDLTLDLSSTYTIDLAADVVGYAGHETNAAVSTTLKTGIIADGTYYFKRNGTETYLTRGGNYGTEAVTDKFGISFGVAIQSDGAYTFKNIDQSLVDNANKYLNLGTYTDQTTAYHWTIASATGGYYLKSDASTYMKTGTEGTFGYQYLTTTATEGEAIIWTILTKSQYNTALSTRKNNEAAAIATAAGRSETTEAALVSALASDFGETDKTSSLTNASLADNADGWTAVSYNAQRRNQDGEGNDVIRFNGGAEVWNYIGGAEQTVSSLSEGIYKVTVKSVWRIAASADATRAGSEANVTAWMYANDKYTQLKSWYDYPVANNAALHASTDDTYVNTVYVYVEDGEDLTIGIASPSWCGAPWMPFYDFTLTYYEPKATTEEKKDLADAIDAAEDYTLGFESGEYAPYNNVDALTKLAAAKAIDPETASGSAVVAATDALTGATWTANVREENAIYWNDYTSGDIAGDGYIHPLGWTNTGYNTRIYSKAAGNQDTNTGISAVNDLAMMMKFNTTYGETTGYTMPLKAATIYKITFKYCGWGNNPTTNIVLTDPSDNTIALAPGFRPATNDGNTNAEHWYEYTGYFVSTTAGNYVLAMNKVDGGQQQIGIGEIELVSASELEFADGSVPTYAPGTYPSVKITRTLTANRWATAIYPFAVSGVDNIAVLDSYNKATGALGFTSAAASTANEPFFMMSETGKSEISLSNVEVAAVSATPATANEASLIGAYTSTDITNEDANYKNYVLSNNEIFSVGDAGATINPYRAYIQISQDALARDISFVVDGQVVTGIGEIEASGSTLVKDGKYLVKGNIVIVKAGKMFNANGAQMK